MRLYDFQERAVAATLASIASGKSPVLVSPTGSGKTVMGVEIVRILDVQVLWIAHTTELIDQAARHLEEVGGWVGMIKADREESPLAQIQVASKATLLNRRVPEAHLIIIDEAHHAVADSDYDKIRLMYPCVPIIGLTATPFRLDGQGLGDIFDDLIVATTTAELVARGILHAPRVFMGEPVKLDSVSSDGGDYNQSKLSRAMRNTKLAGDIVATWKTHALGKRTIAFGCDVVHSLWIRDQFRAAGFRAEHVDGTTDPEERKEIIARLERHEIDVVCNAVVFTEGFDLPALECAIDCAPTLSLNRHLQKNGRIMRRSTGKHGCIMLDFAGNTLTHGPVTRKLTYSLVGKVKVESDPLGLRRCNECQFLYNPEESACPECGAVPEPVSSMRTRLKNGTGTLREILDEMQLRQAQWDMWCEKAERLGYKDGWVAVQYHEMYGEWPLVVDNVLVVAERATKEQKREVYKQLLVRAYETKKREGWASHRYHEIFGVWPQGFVNEVRSEVNELGARWDRKLAESAA